NAAELTAYPGVRRNEAFSIIADRVAQINAREIRIGSASAEASGNTGLISNMLLGAVKDKINEQIKEQIAIIDEQIREMKESGKKSGMDEEMLALIINQMEDAKSTMLAGLQGNETSQGSGAAAGGGYTNVRPDKLLPSEAMKGYDPDDEKAAAEWALSVAGDMASATIFGCVTPGLVNAAGLAVSVYPHPLVLNNYAGLLGDNSPADALFFYFAALEFEPRNPIILTNIGMTFLDMGNYEAAKEYALMALSQNPECGQAYQILTMCHLKDGNSELAAETLFKSTRDYFDDLTVQLFRSYFSAVDELRMEKKDKYGGKYPDFPINEVVLELLYETAKKYVDTTEVNESVDSPAAQLNLEPYPHFGGGEDIMNSIEDYWTDLVMDRTKRDMKLDNKRSELERKIFNRDGGPETLSVVNNIRQYYAYLTLERYYRYQYSKKYYEWHYDWSKKLAFDTEVGYEFSDALWPMWQAACVRETAIIDEMNKEVERLEDEIKALYERIHELAKPIGATGSAGSKGFNSDAIAALTRQVDHLNERIKETKLRYMIQFYKQCQSDIGPIFELCKRFAARYVEMDKEWYDENKQLMEEFWLKAGGVLKYMTNPDMLELCETLREMFVLEHVNVFTYSFETGDLMQLQFEAAESPNSAKNKDYYYGCIDNSWGMGKHIVEHYYYLYNFYQEEIDTLQGQLDELIAQSHYLQPPKPVNFSGSPVEIEGAALPVYKDPNSEPTQGFTVGGYYYRYNSDGYSWNLPFDDRGKYEYAGERTTIYERDFAREEMKPLNQRVTVTQKAAAAYDVATKAVEASELPDKIRDFAKKITEKEIILDTPSGPTSSAGIVKKGLGMIGDVTGYIGIVQAAADVKTAGKISYSKYVTRDSRGRVLDQGDVYERQVGGGVHGCGRERTTTVMRSKMTGVATRQKTLTYKYKFGTVTY
ncbi:MAG: hypothetical protein LBH28_07930, partial [Oscillospiraceae bacterium]|nr:hypothetical protein [Oscillospiraceae bacterium]